MWFLQNKQKGKGDYSELRDQEGTPIWGDPGSNPPPAPGSEANGCECGRPLRALQKRVPSRRGRAAGDRRPSPRPGPLVAALPSGEPPGGGHPAAKPNELCPLLGSRQVKNFNQRPPIFRNRGSRDANLEPDSNTRRRGLAVHPRPALHRGPAAAPPARHPARASAPARPAVARSRAGFGSARAGGGAAAGATGKGHGGDASAHERGARRSSPAGRPESRAHAAQRPGAQRRPPRRRERTAADPTVPPQQTQQCHPAGSAREEMKQRACQDEGDTEGGHRKGDIWPEKGPEGASCAKTREATPRPGNRQCKGPEVNGVPARRVGRLDRRAGSGGGKRWGGRRLRQRPGTGGARRGRQRRLPRARWLCPALTLLRGA